jgi:hypothetical protein
VRELEKRLRRDLIRIGLTENFNLDLRGYSKSYYGRYDPNTDTVILYPYKTAEGDMYSYEELLMTLIHEVIHCKQWHDPSFKRLRGVMHDPEFKRLYHKYSDRAKALILFSEVVTRYDSVYPQVVCQVPNFTYSFCQA